MRPSTALGILCLSLLLVSAPASAEEFSYQAIASRHSDHALSQEQAALARMQGECLVGLKARNFQPRHSFDPVAEWTSVRTTQLLRSNNPCDVLIMIEVAQDELRKDNE